MEHHDAVIAHCSVHDQENHRRQCMDMEPEKGTDFNEIL
jgi:hypothetical protein